MSLEMRHISIAESSNLQGQSEREFSLILAILCSLLLHVVLFVIIPSLKHTSVQKPIRFEVQMNKVVSAQAASPAQREEDATATQKPVKESNAPVTPSTLKKVEHPPTPNQIMAERPIAPEANEPAAIQMQGAEASKNAEQTASAKASSALEIQNQSSAQGVEIAKDASVHDGNKLPPVDAASSNQSEASTEEAWNGYGQQLYEMVGRNKTYPAIAIRKHWEGAVKIQAKFLAGKLIEVSIQDSSGRRVLDDEALNMVKKAISQLSVNGSLSKKNFTVVIPVDFSLDS